MRPPDWSYTPVTPHIEKVAGLTVVCCCCFFVYIKQCYDTMGYLFIKSPSQTQHKFTEVKVFSSSSVSLSFISVNMYMSYTRPVSYKSASGSFYFTTSTKQYSSGLDAKRSMAVSWAHSTQSGELTTPGSGIQCAPPSPPPRTRWLPTFICIYILKTV